MNDKNSTDKPRLFVITREHQLVYISKKSERASLDIKNCRLKRDYFKNSLGRYAYGFILMAKGVTHAFYVKSESDREQWIAKMAPSVISVELFDEFSVQSRPLGKGSQAIVYLCNRKADKDINYALKCFRKRDLQQG